MCDHQDFLDLTTITASHCCICRHTLTDAVSVNRGMGPICSKRYYEVEHVITDEMVMDALGCVAASQLENPVKMAAKHLKGKPREFANVLVKWASAHYDQRDVVFDVADAVGALGFTGLATRLREDRTKVHMREHPTDKGFLTIHTAKDWKFSRYMRRIPKVTTAPKVGRYEGWQFPLTAKQAVLTVLGHVFPEQWATLLGSTGRLSRKGYYDVQQAIEVLYPPKPAPKPNHPVLSGLVNQSFNGILRALTDGKTLEIHTPGWNGQWLDAFKALVPHRQRRWNGSYWTCNVAYRGEVAKLVTQHYQVQP